MGDCDIEVVFETYFASKFWRKKMMGMGRWFQFLRFHMCIKVVTTQRHVKGEWVCYQGKQLSCLCAASLSNEVNS